MVEDPVCHEDPGGGERRGRHEEDYLEQGKRGGKEWHRSWLDAGWRAGGESLERGRHRLSSFLLLHKNNSTCRGMTVRRLYIKKKSSHAGRENLTNLTSTHTQGPITGENDP
jgi:hypothetical protein